VVNLRDMTWEETLAFVEARGLPRYRAEQIFRWVHMKSADSVEEMTDLTKVLRGELAKDAGIEQLAVDLEQVSRDGTRKLRLKTGDARMLETVLIPDGDAGADNDEDDDANANANANDEFRGGRKPEHLEHPLFPRRPKLTQCVSSQVGCALDCTFCATAKLGFGRQLTAGEIVDQVYRAQKLVAALPEDDPTRRAGSSRITNLVFMGMGEPLHNYKNVLRAVSILTDARGADFSWRRITISTAGLVPGIEKLAAERAQVTLAISLNATTDEVRDEIMPINKKWPIARLLEAVKKMPLDRKRRVTFEYVLLDGVNDSDADARRLAGLLHGIPSKVNLIPWNPHPHAPYRRPADARVRAFQDELRARGMAVYVRRSRGDDIDAACGQLAAKAPDLVALRT
jgi:23S rRNA (adenine2503-C2)-methyltransferase